MNVEGLNLLIGNKKRKEKVSLPAAFQGYPFALGESHITVPLYGAGVYVWSTVPSFGLIQNAQESRY